MTLPRSRPQRFPSRAAAFLSLPLALAAVTAATPAQAASDITDVKSLSGSALRPGTLVVGTETPGTKAAKFVLDGKYLATDTKAPFTQALELSAGEHKLSVRTQDAKGQWSNRTTRFKVAGSAAPSTPAPAPILEPGALPVTSALGTASLAGKVVATGTLAVTTAVTGAKSVKYILDGKYLGEDTTAPFTQALELSAGEHKLSVRIQDSSGRTTKTDVRFRASSTSSTPVVTTPPVVTAPPVVTKPPVVVPPVVVPPVVVPPVVTTPPATTPTAPSDAVKVATAADLTKALSSAKPGSTISLADGTYTGTFVVSTPGVTLLGSRAAVLTTGKTTSGGYGLHITADGVTVKGLRVTGSAKGVMTDRAERTVLDSIQVDNIGQEAVHFRTMSSGSSIRNSLIFTTGLKDPSYGEGVYIGTAKSNWSSVMGSASTIDATDGVVVENNVLRDISAEGVDVKEGTTGGRITGNRFDNVGFSGANYADSWVDVKGNGYQVTGNSGRGTLLDAFQVHTALSGWGNNNRFGVNVVDGSVPGVLLSVQKGATGTTLTCQLTRAAAGMGNVACS